MNKKYFQILILLTFTTVAYTQNKSDFFKVFPVNDPDMPLWAEKMYAPDPNVHEVQYLFKQYANKNGFKKTLHTQNYKHWIRQVDHILDDEGFIREPSEIEQHAFIKQTKSLREKTTKNAGEWIPLGPFETYVQGTTEPYSLQTNVYSIDVFPSNTDILICGSETGTVFYSENKGLQWQTISDDAVFSGGITAVKIHPQDPSHFFIGVDNHVYETFDAGASWVENYNLSGSANEFTFDPTNSSHIFCSASSGLFESMDGGTSWQKIFSEYCYDIIYHATKAGIIYTLKNNDGLKRPEVFKSIDNGMSWELKDNNFYMPQDPANASVNGGKLGVSPEDPNRIYACLIGASKADDNGWIGVYRSNDEAESWYLPIGQIGGPYNNPNDNPWNVAAYSDGYHQGFYNFDLEVSPSNADLFWIGTIRLSESSDGGESFNGIGAANSIRLNNQHADIQDIEVVGNEIWVASDGGINYSNDNEQSCTSRKNGVNGADFWGFGSGWNEDILVGGKYHNGNSAFFQSYTSGIFHHVGGVEESTGYVHPMDSRKAMFNKYWAGGTETVIIPETLGAAASYQGIIPYIPNEAYTESWSSGFFFDPRYADHIYMGKDSMIWKSVNGGSYFESLHDFGPDRRVLEIKISRANPDLLFCVVGGPGYWDASEMYRSEDGGNNWSKLANIPTNMWRVEISLNPANENEIWASANSGSNGNKVFQSLDKGESWSNKTTSILNGRSIKDICFQGGTEGIVYLACRYAMFKFDPDAQDWINISDGLPFVVKAFEMRPFYRDQKMRIGTYGKGFWETTMEDYSMPLAQAMTHSDKIYCSRDTVQFDCYSILAHEGASWSWNFNPAPEYISDPNSRNPTVVFGQEGNFDVSLSITDQFGNTSSQMLPSMVEVINYCEMDSVPGMSLHCFQSGDFAQTSSFDKTIKELSVSAWIKPDGIQPDYTGIFMHDGNAAGFNFKNGDNTLGYHWPGGQWWWSSEHKVPENEWSHVAMVVTPDSITLYLNGVPSTQKIALQELEMGTCKIGSYNGWESRNFVGEIDEVAVWDRALSQDEIRKYRHLTKQDYTNDPNFIAYYQFNAPILKIMDRISAHHANLSGTAEKLVSGVPAGGGSSAVNTIENYGVYDFSAAGGQLSFVNGLLPDGEVYLSQINLNPNHLPNEKMGPDAYWILNNYGANEPFSAVGEFRLDPPFGSPIPEEIDDPSLVRLFSREVNGDEDNWGELCEASSADSEFYSFGPDCEISFESQFQFTSNEPDTVSAIQHDLQIEPEFPKIYPTPVKQGAKLTIDNRGSEGFNLIIFDNGGARKEQVIIKAGTQLLLETKALVPGIYFYEVSNKRLKKYGRIVVQ
jgi:photosystem II stability/assembly factor-like uncharacterized protein